MASWVVHLPGALAEDISPLFERRPLCRSFLERSQAFRLKGSTCANPELAWVGLDPSEPRIPQGPLTAAALGADPPPRSVQFHLSLLSTDGSKVLPLAARASNREAGQVMAQARRLETPKLRIVTGEGEDHALVWEDGSIDLRCWDPSAAADGPLSDVLPEGDGEVLLRRFIDDSVNLLSGLELNRVREEEGLQPLNLLWPWEPGFRPALPNLAARRGAPAIVESSSFRLAGIARLVGYRHGDPFSFGSGTSVRLERVLDSFLSAPAAIAAIPNLGAFREQGKEEEARWLEDEIAGRLLEPLISELDRLKGTLMLASDVPGGSGLALVDDASSTSSIGPVPLTLTAAEDPSLPLVSMHALVDEVLTLR